MVSGKFPVSREGGQETLELTVLVSELGEKVNTAEVIASSQYDPDSTPGNNDPAEDDQDSVSLTPQLIDLALTEVVDDPTPNVGDIVTLSLPLPTRGPRPQRVWWFATNCPRDWLPPKSWPATAFMIPFWDCGRSVKSRLVRVRLWKSMLVLKFLILWSIRARSHSVRSTRS